MKLTIPATSLAAGLKAAIPAVATRSGLPILSAVRLEASKDGLAIEATDLEFTARRIITDAAIETPGVAVVSAKALAKAVATMIKSEIELESTPDRRAVQPRRPVRNQDADAPGMGGGGMAGHPAALGDRSRRLGGRLGRGRCARSGGRVRVQ